MPYFKRPRQHASRSLLTIANQPSPVALQDIESEWPLHVAVSNGNTSTVHALYHMGYDFNLLNEEQDSALHIAVKAKKYDILKLLLQRSWRSRINVNIKNGNNQTALFLACAMGYSRAVRLLANHTRIEPHEQSPIEIAISNGHTAVVDTLLKSQRLNIDKIWLKCLILAVNLGDVDSIDHLLIWRQLKHKCHALTIPVIQLPEILRSEGELQTLLTCLFRHGFFITYKPGNEEELKVALSNRSLHNRIAFRRHLDRNPLLDEQFVAGQLIMPVGISALGECYLDKACAGDEAALTKLNNLPSSILVNWFQGCTYVSPELARLSLRLIAFRFKLAHPHLPMLYMDERVEKALFDNDYESIADYVKNTPTEDILKLLTFVLNSPETFFFHQRYKKIRQNIEVFHFDLQNKAISAPPEPDIGVTCFRNSFFHSDEREGEQSESGTESMFEHDIDSWWNS